MSAENRNAKTRASHKRRTQLWDGLTISLAIAVVLLGLAIFFMPKQESKTENSTPPSKQLPASMAQVQSPAHLRAVV